jgi:aminopeptidase N
MYYKGGNMLHTIRQIVDNDTLWRSILRGLNSTFWHQTVTGKQVQDYMSRRAGKDLSKVFEQYLTTTTIPRFEYKIDGSTLSYRWANVVNGFDMPIKVTLADGALSFVRPGTEWKTVTLKLSSPSAFRVDENFYVDLKDVTAVGR